MPKDLSKRAKEIIEQIHYVTIASVDEAGMPWNAPVFAVYDDDYNFYWGTYKDSQKARNIAHQPNVFLVIYDSTVPAGAGEGVYIKAKAEQITDVDELRHVLALLTSRHDVPYWDFADVNNAGPIYLYKATPEQAWMNDEGQHDGHYIDTRTEIQLGPTRLTDEK